LFHRQRKTALSLQTKPQNNLFEMVTVVDFLAETKRQSLLKKIRDLNALDAPSYESLCALLVDNLVNYCQNLPETANSYYSQAGGLVDFALNRTEAALALFRDFLVLSKPGAYSEEQKLWQYALQTAALLQGIGKLYVDYKIHLFDKQKQIVQKWNPLHEALNHTGKYYNYEMEKESNVEFRRRLNLLLAKSLMPASGFAWISSNPQVLEVWLALLNEDLRSAGTLGALLIRANAIAIQRYIGEFMIKSTPNRAGRYGLGGAFSGGSDSLIAKEQAVGVEFIKWLSKSLEEGQVMINKAPLFMVPGGMLMSQEMFQLFVRENPEYKNWQAIQQGFLSLGLHTQSNELSRFEQANNQQMHTGIVFSEFAVALPENIEVHQISTGKIETVSAMELIHRSQYPSQFTRQNSALVIPPLQKLTSSGAWQAIENDKPAPQIGMKSGG
jgi:integrating conjugative element relaxase (TIGR03760 family)